MSNPKLVPTVICLLFIGLLLVACDRGEEEDTPISVAPTDPPIQAQAAAPSPVPPQPTATQAPPPAQPAQAAPPLALAPVVSLDEIRLPAGSLLQDNLVLPAVPAFQELVLPGFDGSMDSLWDSAGEAFDLDQENLAFFTAPADLSAPEIVDFFEGEALRLGGVVVEGDVDEGGGGGRVVWTRDDMKLTVEFGQQQGGDWLLSFGFDAAGN
jgi:hypothetical protein